VGTRRQEKKVQITGKRGKKNGLPVGGLSRRDTIEDFIKSGCPGFYAKQKNARLLKRGGKGLGKWGKWPRRN